MAGYIELRDGYRLTLAGSSTTGIREFVEHSSGTDDLPSYGDGFGEVSSLGWDSSNGLITCQRRVRTAYAVDSSGDDLFKWVCHYGVTEYESTRIPKDEPRSIEVAFEANELPYGDNGTWDGSGETVEQDLVKILGGATFTITEEYSTYASAISGMAKDKSGKVKTGDEKWLYVGAELTESWDDEGDDVFTVVRVYRYRDADGNGWNYVWNKDTASWDKPLDASSNPIYDNTSFNDSMPW